MTLSSLLVCADEASVQVLKGVLEELGIQVELCPDAVRAAVRVAQQRFDLLILDCETQADVIGLLGESRGIRAGEHPRDVFAGSELRVVQAGLL